MKELGIGLATTIFGILVFTPVIIIGAVYTPFYAIYMAFAEKSIITFFRIMWRLIDGTLATIGNFLRDGFAVHYDELANVYGEWIEDSVTPIEQTMFGEKNITISQSVGHLEHEKKPIFPRGQKLSRVLNWAFREQKHALGSYQKWLAYKEIDDQNLTGKH